MTKPNDKTPAADEAAKAKAEAETKAKAEEKAEKEAAAKAKAEEESTEGLVEMKKGGERLHVHPSTVAAHETAGWKIA